MAAPDFTPFDVAKWIQAKPGVFEGMTVAACGALAWDSFSHGHYPGIQCCAFFKMLARLGYEVTPSACGGFILGKVT